MTLDNLIRILNNIKYSYSGDLKVVLASDSEGNSFSTIDFCSVTLAFAGEDDFVRNAMGKDFNKEYENFIEKSNPVGVCIYPFEENFETAEKACLQTRKRYGNRT